MARIVIGYENHISVIGSDSPHFRSLAAIAVAAAAEHDKQTPALGYMAAQSGQRIFQRIRRMRIIDKNRCAFRCATGQLHAPARRL